MRVHLGRRDRDRVARSLRLWRRVHEELRDAAGWGPCREEWTLAGRILPGGVEIRSVLLATPLRSGIAIRSSIEIRRHSAQERPCIDEVRRVLKARGYEPFRRYRPEETTYLHKRIASPKLSDERRWLAAFFGTTDDPATASPRTVTEFTASFGANGAGPWLPYRGAWERRRAIEIDGRKMEAGLMLHLAPRDLRGLSLGLWTSIAIWPAWNGRGPLPRWLEARRAKLARQYRAAGHRAEWHRGPGGRGVGIISLVLRRSPVAIGRIRRGLDSAELGDGP